MSEAAKYREAREATERDLASALARSRDEIGCVALMTIAKIITEELANEEVETLINCLTERIYE